MSKSTEKIKQIFHSMFSLRNDMASYDEIENTIVSGAKLQGTNACILILAILVASVGLNMNSTAVIIGAMLISPLMGGITSIAYGFATNNLGLAKWSAFRLGIQVCISILTSCVYFSVSPITEASGELLARTSPTVWDVIIAICGGLAGIIGQTRKEKSNVIPGVAIATALMPPLCTAGYGLAHMEFSYFFGALYLFFINGFFICVTAILVLKYLRVPQFKELGRKALSRIHRYMFIIAIITMIPSIYLAYDIVADSIETNNAESYIKKEFVFDGTQIMQKNIDTDTDCIEISLLGRDIGSAKRRELKDKLKDYGLGHYKLKLTQTNIDSGVSADEVRKLVSDMEETEDQPNVEEILTQKENEDLRAENEELQQDKEKLKEELEAERSKVIDVKQISGELNAINGKIDGAAAVYADVYLPGENNGSGGIIINLLVSEELSQKELDVVHGWLEKRLDSSEIAIFQQKTSVFKGEEQTEDKKKDTSSEKKNSDSSKADG
ncbi:MAG: DUF389 domain-containing protein [Ruminococcus sp.]|nr:DUF389 domain-containing protein [Ruminococcus sp.]